MAVLRAFAPGGHSRSHTWLAHRVHGIGRARPVVYLALLLAAVTALVALVMLAIVAPDASGADADLVRNEKERRARSGSDARQNADRAGDDGDGMPPAPRFASLTDAASYPLSVQAAVKCAMKQYGCKQKIPRNLRAHHVSFILPSEHDTPGGVRYMHMITIARLPSGQFVSAWQQSSIYEGCHDQEVRIAFSSDTVGKRWYPSAPLPFRGRGARWSPVLHVVTENIDGLDDGDGDSTRRRTLTRASRIGLERENAAALAATATIHLFFSESRECLRPPPPDQPEKGERWVPGGDIFRTTATVRGFVYPPGGAPRPSKMTTTTTMTAADEDGEQQNFASHAEGMQDESHWDQERTPEQVEEDLRNSLEVRRRLAQDGEEEATATVSWAEPTMILSQSSGGFVPKVIANSAAVLRDGKTWLLPFWRERHAVDNTPCASTTTGSAGVLRSTDGGRTFRARGHIAVNNTWLIENSVAELTTPGHVLMLFRSRTGFMFASRSKDGGATWSAAVETELPNPDSKAHMLRLSSGHLALALNSHAKLTRPFRRVRSLLDIAVSGDDGRTWTRIARLDGEMEEGLRAHYPTLLQVADGISAPDPAVPPRHVYVAYSKFFHESYMTRSTNRTDLGILLKRVELIGRLPTRAP